MQHTGNGLSFAEVLPPGYQTNSFAYNCRFTLRTPYSNGMLDHSGKGCQNAQKHILRAH